MKTTSSVDREGAGRSVNALKTYLSPGRYHRLMQVIGRIARSEGDDPLKSARNLAVLWLKKKKWNLIDSQVSSSRPVHLEDENSVRALSIESAPGLWAVRLDDPCSQVAGRQWRVELVLVDRGINELPAFGCTLSVLVPSGGAEFSARPGVPSVVGMMARTQELQEAGRSLDGTVWEVDRPGDLDNLFDFIESKSRPVSVVVVSRNGSEKSIFDPKKIADFLAGVAIVVEISPQASQEITRRYGRSHGIFGDAARIFRIGFDPDVDDKSRHPLFIANNWRGRAKLLIEIIASIAMADTVARRDDQRDFPSFGVIRAIAADQRIKAALDGAVVEGSDASQLAADVAALRQEAKSWESFALEEERRANEAEEAKNQASSRLYLYASRIRELESELDGFRSERKIDFSRPLDQLLEWAEENFAGRIVITQRAARAAASASSDYRDSPLVLRCISLLANEYWQMKVMGGADLQARCKEAEAALGVHISPSGAAPATKKYEDEYQVRWEGRSYKLDMHLSGSDSRDIRRGLRIYFAWDEDQELIIIGHLPTHLTNAHT